MERRSSFSGNDTQVTTGAPHFIETGHMEPTFNITEQLKQVKKVVFHALDSLEITYGACLLQS